MSREVTVMDVLNLNSMNLNYCMQKMFLIKNGLSKKSITGESTANEKLKLWKIMLFIKFCLQKIQRNKLKIF